MKQIKSFEFRMGWGGVNETIDKVNHEIKRLNDNGIGEIDINITCTGKGVMYTLIWEK